ncbi:cytoplasmic dynein intermediate chain [Hortaea werneckii]|nr:cytoplasmic dynein intermediate chain [Hortaea werneckii]
MSSSVQSRKDEILAKKAKLAELKRQRELRQKEFTNNRQSLGEAPSTTTTTDTSRSSRPTQSREDIDSLISSILPEHRPTSSPSGRSRTSSAESPLKRASGVDQSGHIDAGPLDTPKTQQDQNATSSAEPQTFSFAGLKTVYDIPVESKPEIITYSKGVQTEQHWEEDEEQRETNEDDQGREGVTRSPSRRRRRKLSERGMELEEEEEIRRRLRQEIEEELKALQLDEQKAEDEKERFPARALQPDELNAVTSSNDFLDFIERSSKVIERALDEEYDVLADYTLASRTGEDEDEDEYVGRKGRRIKEVASFDLDDNMGKRRMISGMDFSPKFPELLCTSYTKSQASPHAPPGLLNVWNLHLKGRPEYSLHATSDLLSCLFHPHHPSLILGGTYSGQLCLWDTRARHHRTGEPVQRTPLTGGRTGHAHPIYSLAVVGTQNASSIISVSTDGVVCAWSTDMLTLPQEYLELHSPNPSAFKTDDVAPTCLSFPASDPTMFLAGTEQGAILPIHRYDRAGAKAGVDTRTSYLGHMAPITALDFHPSRGKIDLGDLFISSGMDWTIKLWRSKPASSTSTTISGQNEIVRPILDIQREDTVYDVRWSPTKPSIFGSVDGSGSLDIWDVNLSSEIPVASARPSQQAKDLYGLKSLNKLSWEKSQGRHVAVGGLDGTASVFELGGEIGGLESKGESWVNMRKWVSRAAKSRGDV